MEKHERRQRIILFLAFINSLIAVGLLGGALGSDDWVNSDLVFHSTGSQPERVKDDRVNHGLFKGRGKSPGNLGVRFDMKISCSVTSRICNYEAYELPQNNPIPASHMPEMSITDKCHLTTKAEGILQKPGEISFWMWISTLIFICIAIGFGLIAAIFTMVNVIYVPISDIAGVRGVYVWNAVAGVCTVVALCVWAGLHHTHLIYNMLPTAILALHATNCGLSQPGTAIWLCLAAVILFIVNIVLIRLRRGCKSPRHPRKKSYSKGEDITLY